MSITDRRAEDRNARGNTERETVVNAAFHQLCIQPEGQERRDLLAMQSMLNEGIRDIRIHMASRLRELRRFQRSLEKAEAAREQVQKKLRGEL